MSATERQGTIHFNVNFDIDLAEMKEWPPARIAQFFRGITTAIKAREGIPESADQPATTGGF